MKIKEQKKINRDPNSLTPFGYYVEYREVLLRCEKSEGECDGCYFYDIENNDCNVGYKESGMKCFDCSVRDENDDYINSKYIYEDKI